MKWSELPQSKEADDALRVAAAEEIIGWPRSKVCAGCDQCELDGSRGVVSLLLSHHAILSGWTRQDGFVSEEEWLYDWNRDDLARVFMAALNGVVGDRTPHTHITSWWITALEDPRAALCQLLNLLNIKTPNENHHVAL